MITTLFVIPKRLGACKRVVTPNTVIQFRHVASSNSNYRLNEFHSTLQYKHFDALNLSFNTLNLNFNTLNLNFNTLNLNFNTLNLNFDTLKTTLGYTPPSTNQIHL